MPSSNKPSTSQALSFLIPRVWVQDVILTAELRLIARLSIAPEEKIWGPTDTVLMLITPRHGSARGVSSINDEQGCPALSSIH